MANQIWALIFLVQIFAPVFSEKCGYESCPATDPNVINVHLVPHSHDDVGWLKTVDQYFYGLNSTIRRAGVQYIIDTVIQELEVNPSRRFIYVETVFFHKWWKDQRPSMRSRVEKLVKEGRLIFVNAGWSMNDEACTHYSSIIDQMTLGHQRLNELFSECGRAHIAWQIDPFGHSREQASLFAQMGFDGLFFGRLDWRDKIERQSKHELEMIWRGNDDLGKDSDLFTGVLFNQYHAPDGFCFDDTCTDAPIVDQNTTENNVQEKVQLFYERIIEQANAYNTNHIIMTMGGDFMYQNAHTWYKNLDKLIYHVNKRKFEKPVKLIYSTPDCYLWSLNKLNRTWPIKSDDFFPYASDPHAYFTGYFVSRAAIKELDRETNAFFQSVKLLQVLTESNDKVLLRKINNLRSAMGIWQHHDAVAGTEKQHVASDYTRMLVDARDRSVQVVSVAFSKLLPKSPSSSKKHSYREQHTCPLLNISSCSFIENQQKYLINFFNPYSHDTTYQVRLPTNCGSVKVFGPDNQEIPSAIFPVPKFIAQLPFRPTNATHEIVFYPRLSGLSVSTYFVETICEKSSRKLHTRLDGIIPNDDIIRVDGKGFTAEFDSESGDLRSISLQNGSKVNIKQQFLWYNAMAGDNTETDKRASGAYIFRPNGTVQTPEFKDLQKPEVHFRVTSIVTEITQYWPKHPAANFIGQTWRISPNHDYIEHDYVIGPIRVENKVGKEIVNHINTDLQTNATFYTDANGRQMMKRIRDYRPTYSYTPTEPVSGNYYPINSRIAITDEKRRLQLTVLTDRTQGGGSIHDGQIEIMVNRRLLYDDLFGVGEALDEPGEDGKGLTVRGRHRFILSTIDVAAELHRSYSQQLWLSPLMTFDSYPDRENYSRLFNTEVRLADVELPANIQLLTLEYWSKNQILIRLEHFYESKDNSGPLSQPVRVDLRRIFKNLHVKDAREVTMTGNQLRSEERRLQWRIKNDPETSDYYKTEDNLRDFIFNFRPMEIRTFFVRFEKSW